MEDLLLGGSDDQRTGCGRGVEVTSTGEFTILNASFYVVLVVLMTNGGRHDDWPHSVDL
jgi:hypothetical protein